MAPPDDYGWAYIDAQRATSSADGPSGSLQFRKGDINEVPGRFSGSADLVFYAASDDHKAAPNASGSALYLYGDMFVTGAIHAETYTIRQVTATEVDVSGSTIFGDSSGDTHRRTGSFEVSGPSHFAGQVFTQGVTGSGEIHADRLVSNDIFTSGSVGIGTSTPTAQPAEKNDLVIGNHTGNRGMSIASTNTGVGTIRFAPNTSANDIEGWIDYSGNSKKMRIGTDGLTTRVVVHSDGTQVTGTLEVSSNTNIAGNTKLGAVNSGTGSTSVTTFYNTLSGAAAADGGGDLFVNQLYANDIFLSGTATGITATFVSGTTADPRSYSYLGWETSGFLKASGSLTLGGAATIGTTLAMPDNTSGKILVADGNSFQEVAVSGDVSISSAGAVTIAAGAVETAMLNDNIISGQTELAHADIADADELMISDGGTLKRVGVDSLRDHYFGVVSGDATVADGGALTIAADAVHSTMLNDDCISGFSNIGANALAQADELLVSDAGTLKAITFSNLEDAVFSNVSGDATIANGGALTIAAGAVENSMLADDAVGADELASDAVVNASIASGAAIDMDKLDGGSLAASLSDLAQGDLLIAADVDASNALKSITFSNLEDAIFGNISGDATVAAGGALTIAATAVEGSMLNTDVISAQTNMTGDVADTDEIMISDAGTLKRIDFSVFRDAAFNDVSGDATVAAGGALTIANDAVEQAMIADDAVGADQLAASAVVNASIVDGTINADKLDIDGSTDIGAALADADLIIVDDGAGGTNRKAAMSRVKAYTKTDVGAVGVVEGNKAIIASNAAAIDSGLTSVTGSKDLYFKDVKATSNLISDGGLLVSGSTTLAAGLSSSFGLAIPDNEILRIGNGNDLKVFHNATNTLFVNQTGHMRFDNQATGKHIQMDLGADDATTQFQVRNNSGAVKFLVDPGGTQVTGSFEVSGLSHFTSATSHEAGLTSTTMSGSGNLSAHGSAHIGGTLTMDGAGIVFNVASSAGTVNLQVNDGAGADTAITLGKNGKVTKIGDDTPSDGQYLSWDASGGKVAWSDGTTPDMSGSDNHYSSTEFRTSGDLKVSGSITFGAGTTLSGSAAGPGSYLVLDSSNQVKIASAAATYTSDGAEIAFGADSEVKLIHSHDDGLIIKRTATGDNNPTALTLQSGETTIVNTDVIGLLQWQAPDETQGGDGALVCASIEAIATNTFNATQNPTDLVFKTSVDGAAVKHLALESDGALKGYDSGNATWELNAAGTGSFVQLAIADKLIHTGDANTFINFAPDAIEFHAGTTNQPQMRISSGEIVLNEDSSNRDFRIESNADTHAFFIDGGDATAFCKVAGGYGSTGVTIASTGSIAADNYIHSDERIQSNTYLQAPAIYDGGGNVALSFDNSNGYIDNDVVIESNTARLDLASKTGESIIGIYGPGGAISDGGNIGSLRWYGAETDGKDGNTAQTAFILVEGDESNWTYNSSLGTMMKFAVGIDGSTTLSEVLYLTGMDNDYAKVGIGTSAPDSLLDVQVSDSSEYVARFRQESSTGYGIRVRNADDSAGKMITFSNDGGTNAGHITMDGTTVSYGAFTAYHPAALPAADNDDGYDYGTLVKITSVDSTTHAKSVLYNVEKTTAAQDKAVLGVYSNALGVAHNDDGTEDMESGRHSIFAVGDGHILVCSEGGDIETGDYICSSNTDGHGMKQSDDILRNYTVARASEPVDWSTEDSNIKLIACTYHAG